MDGSRIVAGGCCASANVWETATGQGLGRIFHREGVESAQFSTDGSRIFTTNRDDTDQFWDALSGKARGQPLHHAGVALYSHFHAQFNRDGSLVATAGDEIVWVWDAASGKPLGEPLRHTGGVSTVQFSPGGERIVTAGKDNTARVWDAAALIEAPAPVPAWVGKRVRALVGYEFDADGKLETMAAERQLAILAEEIPGEDAWARLMRWAAKPPSDRTLTPNSRFTVRQIAERERDTLLKEGLESALRYDPATPLARLLLAGVLQLEDARKKPDERDPSLPQRTAFLRDYDLAHMPGDPVLWVRAVRALHDQQDDNRALRALARLDKLAPTQAAALRAELKLVSPPKGNAQAPTSIRKPE